MIIVILMQTQTLMIIIMIMISTILSCAIYTHTPARTSSTNFQLYYFVIHVCSTNWLGHGHGYKWHSSDTNKKATSSATWTGCRATSAGRPRPRSAPA